MKKVTTNMCLACEINTSESLGHFLLECSQFDNIRQEYLLQFLLSNAQIVTILYNQEQAILSILDPVSSKLPENVQKAGLQLIQHLNYQENSVQPCTKGGKAITKTLKREGYIFIFNYYVICIKLNCYWSGDHYLTLLF